MTFHLLRAEDRARTGHPQLGRLTLYQMSYFRLILFRIFDLGLRVWTVIFYLFPILFHFEILNLFNPKSQSGERRIRTFEVETTDLQSVPFGHSGISPTVSTKKEPMEGFEPPTSWLQISCSGQLSYIGLFRNTIF